MKLRLLYSPVRLQSLLQEGQQGPFIEELQHRLQREGYFSGPCDGFCQIDTLEALQSYTQAEGLPFSPARAFCHLSPSQVEAVTSQSCLLRQKPAGGTNILIQKSRRTLTLFQQNNPFRQYPIAIGKPSTPTPLGNFAIATKVVNPGGVLGTRWMGLNFDTYGIHGTNRPWLIGQMVSNGCIRMHNHHAEELFTWIQIGSPVYIRD